MEKFVLNIYWKGLSRNDRFICGAVLNENQINLLEKTKQFDIDIFDSSDNNVNWKRTKKLIEQSAKKLFKKC
jgi:precorrin-6B methylase 2